MPKTPPASPFGAREALLEHSDERLYAHSDAWSYAPSAPQASLISPHAHDTPVHSISPSLAQGRYEKISVLGQGGMGKVWLGWDRALARNVAIKEPSADPRASLYLEHEAEITAKLDHPNIVSIYDIYSAQGSASSQETRNFVMALVPGEPLGRWLETRQGQERTKALRNILEICEAIGHAHARKILHRDLSPNNILITQDGSSRVIDWGLAIDLDKTPQPAGYVGTPGFIAPEQEQGINASPRSDVWSLGAVLHLILCGHPPDHPSARRRPHIDPELEAIMQHALKPAPQDRYPDAAKMAQDLRRWFEGRRVEVYDFPAWRLATRFIKENRAIMSIAALGIIGLAASLSWGAHRSATEAKRAAAAERHAVDELDRGQKTLADLYNEQARNAYKKGDLFEAERLAILSIKSHPTPEARGLLAAFEAAPKPTLVEQVALPPCGISWHLSPYEDWRLCREHDDKLSMWRGSRKQWTISESFWDVRFDQTHVYLINGPRELITLDLKTGKQLAKDDTPGVFTQLQDLARYHTRTPESLSLGYPSAPCNTNAIHVTTHQQEHWFTCADRSLWRLAPGQPAQRLRHHESRSMGAMASSSHGLWAGAQSGLLMRLDQEDVFAQLGEPIAWMQEVPGRPALILVQGSYGAQRIFDTQNRTWGLSLPRASKSIFAHDGTLWTIDNNTARRWQLPKVLPPQALPTRVGLSVVAYDDREQTVIAGDGDANVHLLNLKTGLSQQLHVPDASSTIKSIEHDPKTQNFLVFAITNGQSYKLKLGDSPTLSISRHPKNGDNAPKRMATFADGKTAMLYYGTNLTIFRDDGELEAVLENQPHGTPSDMEASADHKLIVVAGDKGIWLIDQDLNVTQLPGHQHITSVAVNDLGQVIMATREQMTLINAQNEILAQWPIPSMVLDLQWSHDHERIVAGHLDGAVSVYLADGTLLAQAHTHDERVSSVAISASGTQLFSSSWDAHIQRFDLSQMDPPVDELEARFERRWGYSLTH